MTARSYADWKNYIVVIFRAAKGEDPRLKGGKKSSRDRWYGLEGCDDFDNFREWWHRRGKDECGGEDLRNRDEAEAGYETWKSEYYPRRGA